MKNFALSFLVCLFLISSQSIFAQDNHGYQSHGTAPVIKTIGDVPVGVANAVPAMQENEDEENETYVGRTIDHNSPRTSTFGSVRNTPAGTLSTGNLTVMSNFLASNITEGTGYYPPDCNGDVSSFGQMMIAVNGKLKLYNVPSVTGTPLTTTQASSGSCLTSPVFNMNIDSFFNNAGLGIAKITDPRIRFDRFSKRWFILAQDNSHTFSNYISIAISNSAAALTSSSTFSIYNILSTTNDPSASSDWFDYPGLGIDKSALYICGNILDKTTHNNKGSVLFVLRKDSLLAADPLFTVWPRGTAAGTSGSDGSVGMLSPQAVHNEDPNATEGYFIATGWTFGQLVMKRITNPGTSTPSLSADIVLTVPVTAVPIDQPALGTVGSLNTFDDRLFDAMAMKNKITGTVSLWTAHNIEVNTSGVGTAGGGRNGARWYEITNLTTTPTLNQSGTIYDNAATNPRGFIMPSIAMNGQGHALLGGSTSSAKCRIQVMIASRYSSDAAGTLQPFDTLTKVTLPYNPSNALQRWGDYSQTVVDPTDNMTLWTFQEYANTTNNWGLRAIQVKAPPPAQSITVSGSPASFCGPSVALTLNGLATNNAGFFDAGAQYNRLTVSCSSGILVTNVVFISPTQVTCDVNTAGIGMGTYTLTITNPDGQSVTANFTLSSPCTILPIQLISFTAIPTNKLVKLDWKISAGGSADHFEVERSMDGSSFNSLGVISAITSNHETDYTLNDVHPESGLNYYRLKTVEPDGSIQYSEIRIINIADNLITNVYPNPTSKVLNVEINTTTCKMADVMLFDNGGKEVYHDSKPLSSGKNNLQINVEGLEKGVYLLSVTDEKLNNLIKTKVIRN